MPYATSDDVIAFEDVHRDVDPSMSVKAIHSFVSCLVYWQHMNKIASYECKGTVGCGSNLVYVFVPCQVFCNMNS